MAEFKGSKNRVRCAECAHLSGKHCSIKKGKVSLKKRRTCSLHEFKGEYENRVPMPTSYVPHVGKSTKQLIKKLMKLGVVPVDVAGNPITGEGKEDKMERKTFPMPASTATASPSLQSQKTEDPLIYQPTGKERNLLWTPGDEDEPEDNRS